MRKHHGNALLLAELNSSACRGKERHPSKGHALAIGRRILREGGGRDRHFVLNAYKCTTCGYWHNGNSHRRHHVDPTSIARLDPSPATLLELQLAAVLAPFLDGALTL